MFKCICIGKSKTKGKKNILLYFKKNWSKIEIVFGKLNSIIQFGFVVKCMCVKWNGWNADHLLHAKINSKIQR